MTYGWAVIIMLVVVAVLFYLGVFSSSSSTPKSCAFPSGFSCNEFEVDSDGRLLLDVGQATGRTITVTGIGCSADGMPAITSYVSVVIRSGSHAWVNNYTNGTACSGASSPFKGKVILQYTVAGSPLVRNVVGDVSAPINGNTSFVNSGGDAFADRWILVPGNPGNPNCMATDFWVMKYEAKNNGSGTAVSTSGGNPWVSINQTNAQAACAAVGGHLLTLAEAQTINLNVAAQANNWISGVIGTGCMYGGHLECGGAPCNMAFNASSDDNQGYWNGTSAVWDTSIQHCMFSSMKDRGNETRRTFFLSGEVIWDWSGNVNEWLNGTCQMGSGAGYWYATNAEWNNGNLGEERALIGPPNASWNTGKGVGYYLSCNANGHPFLRGGSWSSGSMAGAFTMFLTYSPSSSDTNIGFRCAR